MCSVWSILAIRPQQRLHIQKKSKGDGKEIYANTRMKTSCLIEPTTVI